MSRRPSPHPIHRTAQHLLVAGALVLACVAVALAQAAVSVEVRGPDGSRVDGRVTLTPAGSGDVHSCTTREGDCQVSGVPGGRYVVTFAPNAGEAPAPRNVMIPPSGSVTLRVSAR